VDIPDTTIETTVVHSVAQYMNLVLSYVDGTWLFRGVSRTSWELLPSIARQRYYVDYSEFDEIETYSKRAPGAAYPLLLRTTGNGWRLHNTINSQPDSWIGARALSLQPSSPPSAGTAACRDSRNPGKEPRAPWTNC
jgi:hypothetical protein